MSERTKQLQINDDLLEVCLMLKTRYAGYYSEHPGSFSYILDKSHPDWTIVQTLSDFEIMINGSFRHYEKDHIMLFPPFVPGQYRAYNGKPYINNWVSFETDEKYIINSTLPFATPIKLHNTDMVSYIMHMIATENFFDYEYREQSIIHLFHLLFYKINESHANSFTSLNAELHKIRFDMQSNPSFRWTVPYIADKLNISAGYLQSIYKKTFGISCMEDIYKLRIELAKDYIVHSEYSINEIAEICGYQNTEHFCRQFKRITGMTATAYRHSKH